MKEVRYVIQDALGLHARPASQLSKAAGACACKVSLTVGEQTVDAKRIMGVMRLAAKQGDELIVTCEGEGEEAAAAQLQAFLQANL